MTETIVLEVDGSVNIDDIVYTIRQKFDSRQVRLTYTPRRGYAAKPGGWEGKIWMSEDFNAPLEEFEEYM
ncbi:MAG: DUF2281 domain-containing protein [Clostridiales bacterium]|jgi:hypothetical protein|nr:DUF2281 domain-containing protein [Clostridiales bacterium]